MAAHKSIAGHTFDMRGFCVGEVTETADGIPVTRICGRRWLDIRHIRTLDVGAVGYRHDAASLTLRQCEEIVAERQAEDDLFDRLVRGLGDPTTVEEPEMVEF